MAVAVSKTEVRSTVSPLVASRDEALVGSWKLRIWLPPPPLSIDNPPLWPSPSFFSFFRTPRILARLFGQYRANEIRIRTKINSCGKVVSSFLEYLKITLRAFFIKKYFDKPHQTEI